jgi:hypothetical protein
MHTLIDKIEVIDNIMTYTEVAQTNDGALIEEINLNYDSTLGQWLEINIIGLEEGTILLEEFFNVTPIVHIAKTTVSNGSDLPKVNNMGEL